MSTENMLSQNAFTTFLLIYAAHVDYELTQNEVDFILERTDQATYDAMLELFMNNNDYACMKIILRHKPLYYQNQEAQDKLFSDLKALFEVDGEFSRIEQAFVPLFQKMIEL